MQTPTSSQTLQSQMVYLKELSRQAPLQTGKSATHADFCSAQQLCRSVNMPDPAHGCTKQTWRRHHKPECRRCASL